MQVVHRNILFLFFWLLTTEQQRWGYSRLEREEQKKESNEVLNYRWFLKIHKSYRDRCFDVTLFTCPNFKQWYKNNESQREWKINSASSMKCLIFSSLILVSRNSSSFYFMCQWDPNIFLAKPSNTAEIEQKVFKCYNPRILFGMQTVSMQNFGIPQNVNCFYHQKSIWICDHIHLLCIISVSTSNPASLW